MKVSPDLKQRSHSSTLESYNDALIPMSRMLMSPLIREPFSRTFSTPPSNMQRMAFLMYSWPWILGAKERAS